jgi:hypothetical protein
MHANGFTLQTAREHEAELLNLAAQVKVMPPRPMTQGDGPVWHLRRWRWRGVRAALGARP